MFSDHRNEYTMSDCFFYNPSKSSFFPFRLFRLKERTNVRQFIVYVYIQFFGENAYI